MKRLQSKRPAARQTTTTAAIIDRAKALHGKGDLAAAERLYLEVLHDEPANPDVLHFLGILRQWQFRSDEARALIEQSLMISPAYADAHNSLGNVHKLADRLELARVSYEQALTLQPGMPSALLNLGVVLEATGHSDQARPIYLDLLRRYSGVKEIRLRCGEFLRAHCLTVEDAELAMDCFRWVLTKDPHHAGSRQRLGQMLGLLDRPEEASAVYRDWLALEPDNPIARHMMAANGGGNMPARAADDYLRNVFDQFADSFDQQLIERLHYVAPQRLHAALAEVLGEPRAALKMLDAGCGTGLCGPLFRDYAALLVGIDLSSRMVKRAGARGYDRLEVVEISAFLDRHPDSWDVVLSADTLIYFGDLNAVLRSAAQALRPGGLIGFTLEVLDGDAPDDGRDRVHLSISGRYQHSRRHVENAVAGASCELLSCVAEPVRKEAGTAVAGWVVVARKKT